MVTARLMLAVDHNPLLNLPIVRRVATGLLSSKSSRTVTRTGMMVDEHLVTHLRQILPDILRDTEVTLAYLYGSAAAGQALPTSDIDIALVLCRPKDKGVMSPKERMPLEFDVEDALEQQGIPNADVRIIDDMPLSFRGQVAIRGVRLYSQDEVARVEFETRTWKEYLDFEPVARKMRQTFFDDVQEHSLLHRRQS